MDRKCSDISSSVIISSRYDFFPRHDNAPMLERTGRSVRLLYRRFYSLVETCHIEVRKRINICYKLRERVFKFMCSCHLTLMIVIFSYIY
ncbi:hypothetical protein NY2A_b270L [Paramecium bursaria Chlorella virus NY2A]|uniref:Uncharacterized protein b270L n=1 Tax=Paramecium bursaria Chlorella virus NY2A TaxID=46021 RepID=A7IWE5_PBCVN|nr:hypothetical protein NY2A_b270L [Paramecium bursaria Chlorella virus NY2A]ABT14669.1 hypothetical protein NY2A_b270L [Paramecium bursaria Chlorella virus NY2A]